MPPAAFVSRTMRRAQAAHEQHGLDDEPRWMTLVDVQPALQADDRDATDEAEQEAAGMARRGGGRPAWQVREGDGHGRLDTGGQAAEARAEDDAQARGEIASRANGTLQRVKSIREGNGAVSHRFRP